MPSGAAILSAAALIATHWWALAVAWHLAVAGFLVAVWRGWRPSARVAGGLLTLPFACVSALAWWSGNPFNGVVFAALAVALVWHSHRLRPQPVTLSRRSVRVPASTLVMFGWVYPHFLGAVSWPYLIAAPLGLLPCPTLATVTGVLLVCNMLDSRTWGALVGIAALVYGVIGVFRLGVLLDIGLLAAAVFVLVLAIRRGREIRPIPVFVARKVAA